MKHNIKKLTDREHVIARPSMYIGSINYVKASDYIFQDGKILYQEVKFIPGLIKIINEIIDNSVDVAIKTKFKKSNTIKIKMAKDFIQVEDNGTGIPVKENPDGHQLAELAWGHARAGSNFDDDENRNQIGMNGVGAFATNCFSKKFTGKTDDGKNKYIIKFKNCAESFTEKTEKSSGKTGTQVKFFPDFEKFGITELDETHINLIRQRLINLSVSFPEIKFTLNGKKINVNSFKKYIKLFNPIFEIYETEDYKLAVLPNIDDDFRQFSYVNGLKIPDGGTHIDIFTNHIVQGLRKKLAKKYKTIKPGDIKNKLVILGFLKNVKNTKFSSQSKEKITNSVSEMNKYFGEIPYEKIINNIFKNKDIIDPITEIYRIKEEFKKRQELKGLSKTVKKIKSEKYLPSIGRKKYLLLCEGQSAAGNLIRILGRKECGYYELRGKPLNAYSAHQNKFISNKELSELYKIIQNENYKYVIFANDADLDGIHIASLLIGFFEKYLPEMKGRVGRLLTPVKFIKKNGKPTKWVYTINELLEPKKSEEFSYMKGLGSWDKEDLQYIIEKDGLDKMIELFKFNNHKIIDDWLGDNSEPRKKYIIKNEFNITKL